VVNRVQGNLIGTDKSGTADLGNAHYGVQVGWITDSSSSSKNTIGESVPSDGATNAANTIAFNDLKGVRITGATGIDAAAGINATGNRILSNSIFSNGDPGIELFPPDGPTANDGDNPNTPKPDPDNDTGPNRLQNKPEITSAQIFDYPLIGDTTVIKGNLNSTPRKTFTIQFFSNPSTTGSTDEGKTFLDEIQLKTDKQGNASFDFATGAVLEGEYITATATNKKTGDTSEFSEAEPVETAPPPVIGP
jgi:hypothetical protein